MDNKTIREYNKNIEKVDGNLRKKDFINGYPNMGFQMKPINTCR